MATCLCDAFFDRAARATVRVLEHLGCRVELPRGQTCCGQPAFNTGDFRAARKVARHLFEVFPGEGPIVIPSGSCAAMCRHGLSLAFEGEPDADVARRFSRRCWELTDFIVNGLGVTQWPGRFEGRVALHDSCHTRGTASPSAARELISSLGGCQLVEIDQPEQCCGFGGVFAVTHPYLSAAMGHLKLDHLRGAEPDLVVSLDTSCLMHLTGLGERSGHPIRTRHVAELLGEALAASESDTRGAA
jgi:L-lactate dehydrogenase complex protein LldE